MKKVNLNQMTRIAQQEGRGRVFQAQKFEIQGLVSGCTVWVQSGLFSSCLGRWAESTLCW